MAPDVAIVGEVRDREALPLLLTLSSGVTGYTTIHAGSARGALSRLRFICQLADMGSDLPLSALNLLVTESIDIVVYLARTASGVQVNEIVAVEDLAGPPDGPQFTVTDLFRRPQEREQLRWTGNLPQRAKRAMREADIDTHAFFDTSTLGTVR
jgi:pilus assembly protein CpaF